MKLFLHVGTEKTGSSFLQKLCGVNRAYLRENDFFFPGAGRDERRLQRGTISPGNARELAELIAKDNWASVSQWLEARVRAGRSKGCDRVLLSHELLFGALSRDGFVGCFEKAAKQAGVKSLHALLMIRDPVDQAVSLFKHRAKNGTVVQIDQWIKTGYALPGEIKRFLDQVEGSAVQLQLRKYVKDTESILKIFFDDWLGVERPPTCIETMVNPSLTLSELEVISHLASIRPTTVPLFYARMLAIPPEQKASDVHLEEVARALVGNQLCQFDDLWRDLDSRLREDGGLEIPAPRETRAVAGDAFCFSEAQIRAWAEVQNESLQVRYRAQLWLNHHLRPMLGKIKRKFGELFKGRMA